MADYMTTYEKFTCEHCGAVEYDIVPAHDCSYIECFKCPTVFEPEGDELICPECAEWYGDDNDEPQPQIVPSPDLSQVWADKHPPDTEDDGTHEFLKD